MEMGSRCLVHKCELGRLYQWDTEDAYQRPCWFSPCLSRSFMLNWSSVMLASQSRSSVLSLRYFRHLGERSQFFLNILFHENNQLNQYPERHFLGGKLIRKIEGFKCQPDAPYLLFNRESLTFLRILQNYLLHYCILLH